MGRTFTFAARAAVEALVASRVHLLLRALRRPAGAILRLERVRPPLQDRFQPNRLLEMTPGFLASIIAELRARKIDIVTLDEMHRRLAEHDTRDKSFVCITCDGGYIDHHAFVHPILRKHGAPFAVFIPTSFPDRVGRPWWLVLEAVIAKADRVALLIDGADQRFDCRTEAEKTDLFAGLWAWLWERETNEEMEHCVNDLAGRYGVDQAAICAAACMDWKQIAALAADPLVTIGAQSVNYPVLAKLPDAKVRFEMTMSRSVIESAIGVRPNFFAYPFGGRRAASAREFGIARELGFKAAVTSRPGAVWSGHHASLTALPRVALNGERQHLRYVPALLSGIPIPA
jgi:peptidoglycan/xylan/chitin deacetylase (PgdA/CDA1 family)